MKNYVLLLFFFPVLCAFAQNPMLQKDSNQILLRSAKVGGYVQFNIEAGIGINKLYSNLQRRESGPSHTSSETFSRSSNANTRNVTIGFNFLFGSSPYVKAILGVNYFRSHGEFAYSYSSSGYTTNTSYLGFSRKDLYYNSKIDFMNVVAGLRFTISKRLHIEPRIAFNKIINDDVRITGSITTSTSSIGPTPTMVNSTTQYFENEKVRDLKVASTVSFCPKISYEFRLKEQKFGVYASYNMAYQYRLPWWMLGVTWYPFKKLT